MLKAGNFICSVAAGAGVEVTDTKTGEDGMVLRALRHRPAPPQESPDRYPQTAPKPMAHSNKSVGPKSFFPVLKISSGCNHPFYNLILRHSGIFFITARLSTSNCREPPKPVPDGPKHIIHLVHLFCSNNNSNTTDVAINLFCHVLRDGDTSTEDKEPSSRTCAACGDHVDVTQQCTG